MFHTSQQQPACVLVLCEMRQHLRRTHAAALLLAIVFIIPIAHAQIAQWQSMSPTTGRLGGDFLVTVSGTNFATTTGNTYRCQFEMSARSFVVTSAPVSASSATRVVCTAPAFPATGSTVLKIITQSGSTVTKSGTATAVFVFAAPVATISGPSVFVMADCGSLQTLTLTITMSHPTSNLGINSTLLVDKDTGAVITSGRLASSPPSKQYSVNFTWTPAYLSVDKVSRLLNFSVIVSEVDFATPDRVEVWREVGCAVLCASLSTLNSHFFHLQVEVQSPPEFIEPSPSSNVSPFFSARCLKFVL